MAKAVEPFANFAAQELLKNSPSQHGWVRKDEPGRVKSALKRVFEWPRRFMILCRGCLYLYKESTDSNFCDKYPLSRYRVCVALEITKYHWVFKLIHLTDVQTVFFAVDSEFDQVNWINTISKEKEEFCSFTSEEESDEDHQYCHIDEAEGRTTVHHRVHSCPRTAQPLRPHSHSLPGPSSAPKKNQWSPSLEPRETKKRPHSLPPREDLTKRTLPPPTGISSLNHQSPNPSNGLRTSENLPKSPKESNKPRSSPSRPPPKQTQVTRNSVIQELQDGLAQVQQRVAAASAGGTSMASGTPHQERRTITRMGPEGQSIREKKREAYNHRVNRDPLPSSAYHERLSKESASRLLRNKNRGTYLVRWSQTATEKALSVRDSDEDGKPFVRHYKIFFTEGVGYALEHRGNSYPSIARLLEHHYEQRLPNTNLTLMTPYQ